MVDYLSDQLGGLLSLEGKYSTRDYLLDVCGECIDHEEDKENNSSSCFSLTSSSSKNKAALINVQHAVDWRKKICEWSYQVADHFDLSRDVVYIALNYMDRYCAASNEVTVYLLRNKNRFQLLAMTSLCLAIKVHGELRMEMDMDDNNIIISSDTGTAIRTSWAGSITSAAAAATATIESWIVDTILQLGRDNFTVEQLKTMEVDVLQRLQWLLHPPTPQIFILYYFDEFCPWDEETVIELKDLSLFIIELSVHDYYFVSSNPSIVTLAALYNAAQMLDSASASASASASSIRTMMENGDNDDDDSSTWLLDLQHDLLRHNNNDDYCKEIDNINSCRERLKKLYANTDAKIEDFLSSNHYYPSSSLTNNNNNNNNTDEICREPSPTSVMNK